MTADAIVLKGIAALGHHGVSPQERDRAQPFEVDLEIGLSLAAAGESDDLYETVDYSKVITTVVGIIETHSYQLLEALATNIADHLLGIAVVETVTIEVRKVRPPVPAAVNSVAVRLQRSRSPQH